MGGFHPKASTLSLYAKDKKGGQGLVDVRTASEDKTTKIYEEIRKINRVLSEYLR